jgi:hypothetical protein
MRAATRPANGTLVARGNFRRGSEQCGFSPMMGLSWGFGLERAKGIEPS